jgi:hypothetical protein
MSLRPPGRGPVVRPAPRHSGAADGRRQSSPGRYPPAKSALAPSVRAGWHRRCGQDRGRARSGGDAGHRQRPLGLLGRHPRGDDEQDQPATASGTAGEGDGVRLNVAELEQQIREQLAAHPDNQIFTSLPRSGTVRAARLLALPSCQ